MSTQRTAKMLKKYAQQATPTLFLSGMFQAPAENFHNSEEVEIDIQRTGEDVAIAIQDVSAGYRMNSDDLYTNKSFKPPVFKEALALNAHDLLKKTAGNTPFADVAFRASLTDRVMSGMPKVERKIRRAMELQSSQVLQNGIVDLKDENGETVYTIDYKPKATHFPTAGTAWDQAGATIVDDLTSLLEVVRDDGLEDPDVLIFGSKAFETAIQDEDFQKRLDVRRLDVGAIAPMVTDGQGGQFRGTLDLGNYKVDVWTYNGKYKDPQSGVSTPYVSPANVIARSSTGRLDATFGNIPNFNSILGGAAPILPEVPRRFMMSGKRIDLHVNVWKSNDGDNLFSGVGARPLMIPTAIDTFGCLRTGV